MNKRTVLKELLKGNIAPLQKLVPLYDLDRLSTEELETLRLHQEGIAFMSDKELERLTNKALLKPIKQMTDAQLKRIAGIEPQDLTTLSDDELRKLIQDDENE